MTSTELRYRNGPDKPRHPDAPCDREGRRIEVLREVRGHAAFRYVDSPGRTLYGELDAAEGVVTDVIETPFDELMELLDDLEEDDNER